MSGRDAESRIDQLWADYTETRDTELRNRLVLHYSPLVKYIAGRMHSGLPQTVEPTDLVSDGVIGLMDAIAKFQPDRGLQFQTYAVPRIRGAIIDGLRASDWVPRSIRDKIRNIGRAQVALEHRLGRTPSDEEVAHEMGISLGELRQIYSKVSYTGVASLDELGLPEDLPSAIDEPMLDDHPHEALLAAVEDLTERDQIIVALYYFEGLTLAEIGQVLGVTESRISQLHTRATVSLRARLLDDLT